MLHWEPICTAPLLSRHRDVRPLRGGFDAWVKQGLPVEPTGSLGHGGY